MVDAAGAGFADFAGVGGEFGGVGLGEGDWFWWFSNSFIVGNAPVNEIGGVLAHGVGDVAVDVDGGGGADVADDGGKCLDVHAVLQGSSGEGMPLRYNYDKPEKPRRIKGFEVFSLVFSSFSKSKNHTETSRIIGGVSLTTNE